MRISVVEAIGLSLALGAIGAAGGIALDPTAVCLPIVLIYIFWVGIILLFNNYIPADKNGTGVWKNGPRVVCLFFLIIIVPIMVIWLKEPSTRIHVTTTQATTYDPNLLDLFQNDFANSGGGGAVIKVDNALNLKFSTKTSDSLTLYVRTIGESASNSMYLEVYVPPSSRTADAIANFLILYSQFVDGIPSVSVMTVGDNRWAQVKKLDFTGLIYFYTETSMTLIQLGELESLYSHRGLTVIFRGFDYAADVASNIRAGSSKPIPAWTMVKGTPTEVLASTSIPVK